LPFSDVATNGGKLAEALTYAYRQYLYDMVLVFSDPYVEAQALGCQVKLDPYPVLQTAKSNKSTDRTHEIIKAADILKHHLDIPVFVSVKGVFSLAAFLGGIENFLKITLRKESQADELLEQAMQFQEDYLENFLSLGVNVFIGDPLASSSVISPAIFQKYALNPLETLVRRIKERGALAGIHICGDTRPIMEFLDRAGADILSIEDATIHTKTLRMGGVSTQTILNGNVEDVSKEARSALAITPLILSTSCDVPPQTNPTNIMAMLRAAREDEET
jgi:MtaA/CmuA family methyltransferase